MRDGWRRLALDLVATARQAVGLGGQKAKAHAEHPQLQSPAHVARWHLLAVRGRTVPGARAVSRGETLLVLARACGCVVGAEQSVQAPGDDHDGSADGPVEQLHCNCRPIRAI